MPGGFPLGLEVCGALSTLSGPSSKGVSVTAGNAAYGAWTQIIAAASNTVDACWICVRVWPTTNSSFRTFTNIGVGGSGSEVAIIHDLYASSSTSGTTYTEYWFPCSIPAGTRVSAQSDNSAAADANNVQITLYDGAFTMMEGAAGVDSIGFVSGSTSATDVDPGAVASTYGAWTQLVASTSKDYMGLCVVVGENSTNNAALTSPVYCEIGIGGSGNETVIVPDYGAINGVATFSSQYCPFLPIAIPAGTRVSARAANGNNTAGTRVIGVMAYGVYQ